MSIHTYDRDAIRFAIWVGPGRDPEVAYLDAAQLVITGAELTASGWVLNQTGTTFNTLGGSCECALDEAIRHRIAHAVVDRDGSRTFELDPPGRGCVHRDGLCDMAQPDPVPPMPHHETGSFHVEPDVALQWVSWDDPLRAGTLRRAVYLDRTYVLESALGIDGRPRVWPARGLTTHALELVAPSAIEAAPIEARIATVAGSA